jgi:hypothetical protein
MIREKPEVKNLVALSLLKICQYKQVKYVYALVVYHIHTLKRRRSDKCWLIPLVGCAGYM